MIEQEDKEIPLVLLKLMGFGMKEASQLLENNYHEPIRARYQSDFWCDFI